MPKSHYFRLNLKLGQLNTAHQLSNVEEAWGEAAKDFERSKGGYSLHHNLRNLLISQHNSRLGGEHALEL
jgi:hypothetical protein